MNHQNKRTDKQKITYVTPKRIVLDKVKKMPEWVWNEAIQLMFPRRCPVCDGIVHPAGEMICISCLPKFKLLTPPWCMRCGKKLQDEGEYCRECRGEKHDFTRGRSLYEYDSAAASLYRFKYSGRREYADFYGEQIVEYLGDFIRGVQPDAIIPIPLHRKRKAKRGYNQAELLARVIGRRMGIPIRTKLLLRVKNTIPLKQLNPKERQNNLKKAFLIAGNDVKLKTILLVDDIFTTGSTMDEAARTLRSAGVENICYVTLACGTGC